MKRFLVIGVMAAAFNTHANACVAEYSDHNYYMFSVFNRDQTSPAYLYDIASYWQKYAGNTSSINLSFYRWNKEDIQKVAQSKKDAGMLSYLRNLNAYLDACEKLNPNAWNYASKQERLQIQQSLTRLNNASQIYKGTQLKSQYALLRMRTNMMKGFHQQNITYWNAIASRLPKSPWREAMAETCREFEKLPIIKYADILRNILYSGVWCRFESISRKRREEREKEDV